MKKKDSEIIDLLLDRVSVLENNTLWLYWKNSKFLKQCGRKNKVNNNVN